MSNVDRTYCCNLNEFEDITKDSDTKISSAKTEIRKKRNWGWRRKRPDTPMVNNISTMEWNRSRLSNSECTDSSCPNSAVTLSDTYSRDGLWHISAPNIKKFDLNEEQLRVLSISEENNRNDKGDELMTENSCKRKTRKFRWCKKRVDTPMINDEQKFDWFQAHSSNNRLSEPIIPSSDEKRNNEQSNKSSSNSSSNLVLNSRGIFLTPLITCFPRKTSRSFTENKETADEFEL